MRSLRQLVATGGNGFPLSEPFSGRRIRHRLPLVATARLHKRSIPSFAGVVDENGQARSPFEAGRASITGEGVP